MINGNVLDAHTRRLVNGLCSGNVHLCIDRIVEYVLRFAYHVNVVTRCHINGLRFAYHLPACGILKRDSVKGNNVFSCFAGYVGGGSLGLRYFRNVGIRNSDAVKHQSDQRRIRRHFGDLNGVGLIFSIDHKLGQVQPHQEVHLEAYLNNFNAIAVFNGFGQEVFHFHSENCECILCLLYIALNVIFTVFTGYAEHFNAYKGFIAFAQNYAIVFFYQPIVRIVKRDRTESLCRCFCPFRYSSCILTDNGNCVEHQICNAVAALLGGQSDNVRAIGGGHQKLSDLHLHSCRFSNNDDLNDPFAVAVFKMLNSNVIDLHTVSLKHRSNEFLAHFRIKHMDYGVLCFDLNGNSSGSALANYLCTGISPVTGILKGKILYRVSLRIFKIRQCFLYYVGLGGIFVNGNGVKHHLYKSIVLIDLCNGNRICLVTCSNDILRLLDLDSGGSSIYYDLNKFCAVSVFNTVQGNSIYSNSH